jgi:hypothetical protein
MRRSGGSEPRGLHGGHSDTPACKAEFGAHVRPRGPGIPRSQLPDLLGPRSEPSEPDDRVAHGLGLDARHGSAEAACDRCDVGSRLAFARPKDPARGMDLPVRQRHGRVRFDPRWYATGGHRRVGLAQGTGFSGSGLDGGRESARARVQALARSRGRRLSVRPACARPRRPAGHSAWLLGSGAFAVGRPHGQSPHGLHGRRRGVGALAKEVRHDDDCTLRSQSLRLPASRSTPS